MIDQGLFRKYFVGRDGFYWWIGQIAEESSWVDNKRGIPSETNRDIPGFGERYKVRIMGYHTAVPSELPDDHLPWASVMYPVTAGGGTAATSETANLRQGMFVFGFFLDGEDGQQPVIMGVIGYNDYTAVMAEVPDAKFVPFTGLNASRGQNVATFARTVVPDAGDVAPAPSVTAQPTPQGQTESSNDTQTNIENDRVNNSPDGLAGGKKDAATQVAAEEKQKDNVVPKPSKCDPIPLGGLSTNISNFIKDIEKTRKTATDYRYAATRGVIDAQAEIDYKKDQVTKLIMGTIKSAINEAGIFAENFLNKTIKGLNAFLQPNESYALSTLFNGTVEYIVCMLKQIFKAIGSYIYDLIDDIIGKVINVAKCFINNFVASVLGTINGLINSLLGYATDLLTGVIDSVFGVASATLDTVEGALDIMLDVISFLTCNTDKECDDYYVDEWNILTGGKQDTMNPAELLKSVGDISERVSNVVYDFTKGLDGIDSVMSTFGNTLQNSLNDVFDDTTCDVGPILCGPPSIALFGGTGAGFAANPVLDSNGSIIAVDVISMGRGYSQGGSVTAKVVDACGNGNGGVVLPILGTSLNDLLGIGDGINTNGDYNDNLLGDGRRGVIDSYWQNVRSQLGIGQSETQISGSTFSGLITSDRLTPTLTSSLVGTTTNVSNVSVGGTTTVFDSNILNSLTTPSSSFTGLISGDRYGGLGTETTTVSLSTSFTGASGDPINIGIAAGVEVNDNIDYTSLALVTSNTIDNLISNTPTPSTDTIATGINTEVTDGTLGVSGFIILDGGAGYMTRPDGSVGGMNRTWATSEQTKIKKSNGTYLLPINPGIVSVVEVGDTIEIPSGTTTVSGPLDNDTGGGESIIGGSPHVITTPGLITAPKKLENSTTETGDYPSSTDGTYPVITYLSSIYVEDPGVGYSLSDEVVITPSEGAVATIDVTDLGAIKSIRVTQKGEGFKVKPTVYIKSRGGIGAILSGQLGIDNVDEESMREPGVSDKIIQVNDVVGAY